MNQSRRKIGRTPPQKPCTKWNGVCLVFLEECSLSTFMGVCVKRVSGIKWRSVARATFLLNLRRQSRRGGIPRRFLNPRMTRQILGERKMCPWECFGPISMLLAGVWQSEGRPVYLVSCLKAPTYVRAYSLGVLYANLFFSSEKSPKLSQMTCVSKQKKSCDFQLLSFSHKSTSEWVMAPEMGKQSSNMARETERERAQVAKDRGKWSEFTLKKFFFLKRCDRTVRSSHNKPEEWKMGMLNGGSV